MWPLILLGLGVSGIALVASSSKQESAMTPARRLVFQTALGKNPPLSGNQFMALAKEFDSYGLMAEADILRKRARVSYLPQSELDKLEEAFKSGMSSKDPIQVRSLANAFEAEGLFASARELRGYANTLDVATQVAKTAEANDAMNAANQSKADLHKGLDGASPESLSSAYKGAAPPIGTPVAPNQDPVAGVVKKGINEVAGVLPGPLGQAAQAASGAIAGAVTDAAKSAASAAAGSIENELGL